MTAGALAQMLSTMLYGKRFFPYYVSNVIAGLDEDGNGVVYSYDPVGHCEKGSYHAGGSSGALLQPLLDSQVWQLIRRLVMRGTCHNLWFFLLYRLGLKTWQLSQRNH